MVLGNHVLAVLFIYGSVLLTASFFVHLFPLWLSLALAAAGIAFFIMKKPEAVASNIVFALLFGFFADLYSGSAFPLWSAVFFLFAAVITYIAIRYVRFPAF